MSLTSAHDGRLLRLSIHSDRRLTWVFSNFKPQKYFFPMTAVVIPILLRFHQMKLKNLQDFPIVPAERCMEGSSSVRVSIQNVSSSGYSQPAADEQKSVDSPLPPFPHVRNSFPQLTHPEQILLYTLLHDKTRFYTLIRGGGGGLFLPNLQTFEHSNLQPSRKRLPMKTRVMEYLPHSW
jgi:hypothetical protein